MCGSEVLCSNNKDLASRVAAISTSPVELHVEDNTPHDIVLLANIMGFGQEAKRCMEKAKLFIHLPMRTVNRTSP